MSQVLPFMGDIGEIQRVDEDKAGQKGSTGGNFSWEVARRQKPNQSFRRVACIYIPTPSKPCLTSLRSTIGSMTPRWLLKEGSICPLERR